ncbi:hypothetical protein [Microcoleus sp. herbarium14]|uniref:hypothetical protein n=1 Tax=Microcoleus sp. herbarium14 TaxID=3055439 RepID=UPI002FD71417
MTACWLRNWTRYKPGQTHLIYKFSRLAFSFHQRYLRVKLCQYQKVMSIGRSQAALSLTSSNYLSSQKIGKIKYLQLQLIALLQLI